MRRRLVCSTALLLALDVSAAATAWAGGALPTGGQFTAGAGSIGQTNNGLIINQATTRGIIDWRSFSIGAGNSVLFNNGGGATLNRVSGGDMSTIAGLLKGAGSVFLINPAGVLITPSGQVLTGGSFIASTRDVADNLFMSSQALHFTGSSAGDVVNQGSITAANGDVVLVGRSARNDGQISAANGTVGLAAGDDVLLQPMSGDQRLFIKAGIGDVTNTGTISAAQAELKAADGNVYALAGNNGGIVRATGTAEIGGHVWLVANGNVSVAGAVAAQNADGSGGNVTASAGSTAGMMTVTGTVDTSAAGNAAGGTITLTGAGVDLGGSAVVAANGASGGTILIGGDRHGGQDPSIDFLATRLANSQETVVETGATISANGSAGDGGKIVVWSDQSTSFAGSIAARGGQGGNGGFAEVSGEVLLDFTGTVDLTAPGGLVGTLLLDPRQVTISSGSNSNMSGGPNFNASGNDAVLNVSTLQTALASNNVVVTTGGGGGQNGDITVSNGVSWNSANSLTLTAAPGSGSMFVNAGITSSGTGALTLNGTNVTLGSSVQAPTFAINATGTVSQSAAITATNLNLQGTGSYTLTNGSNSIGTLAANSGAISLVDNTSLTVGSVGGTNGITSSGNVSLHVTGSGHGLTFGKSVTAGGTLTGIADNGNVTLNSGTTLTANGSGNPLILEAGASSGAGSTSGGDFINNSGSSALSTPASNAHWLVYTGDLIGSGTVSGGLSFTNRYNTAAGFTPGTAGNYLLFRAAPTLTLTANNLSRAYGSANPTLTFTVSGLVNGDTQNAALGGSPSLSTSATSTSSVAGGPYTITIATGGVTNPLNYQLSFVNGQLTVTPLTVTLSGITANNKVYTATTNATLNTGSAVLNGVLAGDSGNVSLATGGSTANFADANVGTGKAVTVSGLTLQGSAAGNYALTQPTGLIANITPASLTVSNITASNKVYDATTAATLNLGSASLNGFLGSDNGHASVTATGTIANFASANVGNGIAVTVTSIGLTGSAAGNYVVTPPTGLTANITPATLTYVANSASRTFGAANPAFSGSVTGFLGSDTLANATSGTLAFTSPATASSNVGSYAINGSGLAANNGNYTFVQGAGNATALTITPASLTYTASPASRSFGAANPAFSGTITGFVNGDTQASATTGTLTFTSPATAASNVGSYAINGSGLTANNGNYTFAQAAGNATALTINPATLTYTANTASRSFGAANPAFSGTVSGFVNGDTQANATTGTLAFTGAATASSNVGSYAINGSGLTANNGNYTFVQAAGNATALTINPATLTYTANSATRIFGGANPAFSGTVTGFVNGDTLVSATTGTLAFTSPATASSNVGSYAVNGSGLAANNGNYTFTQAASNATALTITPATLTYVADAVSRTFGAANPAFAGTVTGFVNGDTQASATSGTLSFSSPATAASPVGSYAINGSGLTANNGNYTFVQAAGNASALTINPATLTIAANNLSKSFGSADPSLTFTASGFQVSDTAGSVLTGALTRAAGETVAGGPYAITQGTLAANSNYTIAFTPGTLTINPATLTIAANNLSKTFGAADPSLTFTASGFQFSDTAGSVLTGALTRTAGESVAGGPYAITQGTLLANGNYAIAFTPGALTINPATLTIAANDLSKTFGAADPALTFTASGFQFADTAGSVLTGALTRAAGETVAGGPYAITQGTLAANSNYTITFTPGALTINPATLTIAANNLSKSYGAADPTLTFTASGFQFSDAAGSVLTGALTRAAGETVAGGPYAITQGTLAANSNYTVAFTPGALTINPATLTIAANNLSKTFGAADPTLTFAASGFQFSDAVGSVLTGALTRAAGESVAGGPYAITQGTLAANSNYTIAFTLGALTINPATLTVAANNLSKTFGSADPALTFTGSGFQFSDTAGSVLTGALTRAVGESVASGPYAITQGTLTANGNYTIAFTPGALTINAATLTIAANNLSKTFGAADPSLTFTASGFQFSDTAGSVLTGVLTRAAGETVAGGPYAITQGTLAANSNYTIAFTLGALTVNPATLTYVASTASRTFGAANPAFTGGVSGFVNGDTLASATSGTLTFTSPATAASNVGSYAITGSGLTANNGNYVFTQAAGNASALTINPATLTVAAGNLSKIYGSADPTLTFTASGFALSDTAGSVLSGALARAAGESVAGGPYAIAQGTLASNGNYTIAFTPGALTINPAPLSVVANNLSKTYGSADPALSVTATGLKFADTVATALTGTLTRAAGETVAGGPYAITHGTLAADTNYTLSFTPGALTINPAMLTMTATPVNRLVGEINPPFTGSVTGFANGDTLASATTGTLGFSSIATSASPVGRYAILGAGLSASTNYILVQAAANFTALTVSPTAAMTAAITPPPVSPPAPRVSIDLFSGGDVCSAHLDNALALQCFGVNALRRHSDEQASLPPLTTERTAALIAASHR